MKIEIEHFSQEIPDYQQVCLYSDNTYRTCNVAEKPYSLKWKPKMERD